MLELRNAFANEQIVIDKFTSRYIWLMDTDWNYGQRWNRICTIYDITRYCPGHQGSDQDIDRWDQICPRMTGTPLETYLTSTSWWRWTNHDGGWHSILFVFKYSISIMICLMCLQRIHDSIQIFAIYIYLGKLSFIKFDIIYFSEILYLTEDSILHGNHILITTLSTTSISGVAILIHQKHIANVLRHYQVNDRVLGIDVGFGGKIMRIVQYSCRIQDIFGQNWSNSYLI